MNKILIIGIISLILIACGDTNNTYVMAPEDESSSSTEPDSSSSDSSDVSSSSIEIGSSSSNETKVGSSSSGNVASSSSTKTSSSSVASSSSAIRSSSSSVMSSSSTTFYSKGTSGTITDERDGNTYKWVKIGTQYWLAENLRYNVKDSVLYNDGRMDSTSYSCNTVDSIGCEYTIAKAKLATPLNNDGDSTTDVCPLGWHVSTYEEWLTMLYTIGKDSSFFNGIDTSYVITNAGTALTSVKSGGTDDYGFNIIVNDDSFAYMALDEYYFSFGGTATFVGLRHKANTTLGNGSAYNIRCIAE